MRSKSPFPWIGLALILATTATYISHTDKTTLTLGGPALAVAVLFIISVVLPFQILRRIQDALISFDLLSHRISSRYLILVPFALFIWGIKYRIHSKEFTNSTSFNGDKPLWEFSLGGYDLYQPLWILLLTSVFLHEIYLTIRAVDAHQQKKTEQGAAANP
jgi:hypothetical protein